MDAWEALILSLAGAIGLAVTVGRYLLARLRSLERSQETEIRDLKDERSRLQKQVAGLDEKMRRVPLLEQQVQVLCDQVKDLSVRLAKSEERGSDLEKRNEALTRENRALRDDLETTKVQNKTFREVFALLGLERLSEKTSKAEAPTADRTPESGESPSVTEGEST